MVDFVTGHEGPVMVASHDRAFLDRVATNVVELDLAQQRIGHYTGGWSEYAEARSLERRQAREAFEEYAETRDRLARPEQAARRLGGEGTPQRQAQRRGRQAHPREAPGPRGPAGREGGAHPARGRPARRGRPAAQGVGAALRHRPRPRVGRGGVDAGPASCCVAATSSSARSTSPSPGATGCCSRATTAPARPPCSRRCWASCPCCRAGSPSGHACGSA